MNEIIDDRDMMYGGYFGGTPCNMQYGSFGYQGYPGSFINNNMLPNMMINPNYQNNMYNNQNNLDIDTRLNNLETRVRLLEQRFGNNSNSYQEDNNSMYMI